MARLADIGTPRGGADGFSALLLHDTQELLARAGDRLRLSAEHTIVVLAGGTGSGKSSLFNRLAGAQFSPVGAVRPVTREPYSCVWGAEGAGPLLDWLGVESRRRYARSSALDEGERAMAGLLLVDLPDHDSVLAGGSEEVSRLVEQADLIVWVLDPQKYADAAVHSRYLAPMAGHAAVTAVVLNQADLLAPEQIADCEADLRRLLDTEGLSDAKIVVASAVTGDGVGDLKTLLTETVIARQAAVVRLGADMDGMAARFVPYAGGVQRLGDGPQRGATRRGEVPETVTEALSEALSRAAGVTGIGRALQATRELRAVDYLGWPVFWLAERVLGRDRVHRAQLSTLWTELRNAPTAEAGVQQAEIDTAVSRVAAEVGQGMPAPWPGSIRAAARARAEEVPGAVRAAIARALPEQNEVPGWWRAVAAWHGVLLGAAAVGVAWLVCLVVTAGLNVSLPVVPLLSDRGMLPWVALLLAVILMLGWVTALGCMVAVARSAGSERERAEQRLRAETAKIARDMVIRPVADELSEYRRFLAELRVARAVD